MILYTVPGTPTLRTPTTPVNLCFCIPSPELPSPELPLVPNSIDTVPGTPPELPRNSDVPGTPVRNSRNIGAEALHLFLLVPVGCGVQIGPSHQLPPERYETVLNWIVDRQQSGDLEIKATCAPHYYRIAARRGVETGPWRGCLCGIAVAFISHRGKVFPCGYLPVDCGDATETPLAEIWRTSEIFARLRDDEQLQGRCGQCGYKRICGGCRARAYAATGNYLASEPNCGFGRGGQEDGSSWPV
jgi:radical SAM protein with 4Fe4S-binding SPASM domain